MRTGAHAIRVPCDQVHEVSLRQSRDSRDRRHQRERDRSDVTAFIFSIVLTAVLTVMVVQMAKRRPPGTPLTWGEAFAGGLVIFFLLLMIYGVVPDRWLRYADGELKWRVDKLGIPMGPIGPFLHDQFGIGSHNVIFANGIKFGNRGK